MFLPKMERARFAANAMAHLRPALPRDDEPNLMISLGLIVPN
jgi:hypothetical protein